MWVLQGLLVSTPMQSLSLLAVTVVGLKMGWQLDSCSKWFPWAQNTLLTPKDALKTCPQKYLIPLGSFLAILNSFVFSLLLLFYLEMKSFHLLLFLLALGCCQDLSPSHSTHWEHSHHGKELKLKPQMRLTLDASSDSQWHLPRSWRVLDLIPWPVTWLRHITFVCSL